MSAQPTSGNLLDMERVIQREGVLTIFDAETQDTSYGIVTIDDRPHIFDTHRKDGVHVATIEVLTEVKVAIRIRSASVGRFVAAARRAGLYPIPYSACFFKGNLHVYAYDGPLVGLDLSAAGPTVATAERNLEARARSVWPRMPREIIQAQAALLEGRRLPRHPADLEVLVGRGRARVARPTRRTGSPKRSQA